MSDDFLFSNDFPVDDPEENQTSGSWNILIVDDEQEVHAVTKLALSDFQFQNKSLNFISAYDGAEAKKILSERRDIAIVLLDVVMETDDAGLQVADYVRKQLKNERVRIILRTGQPGQAPERQVILNYDINDYKSKTELTAQKLFTVVLASLRSYRDIISLEKSSAGLRHIIEASSDIFSVKSMENFIHGVMQQLTSVIGCGEENALYVSNSLTLNCPAPSDHVELTILAAQGKFASSVGKSVDELPEIISHRLTESFSEAISQRSIVYKDDYLIAYCHSRLTTRSLLFVSGLPKDLDQNKKELVELFAKHVQVAFDNILLKVELEASQVELLERLGGAIERRPNDKGQHIARIVELSRQIATWLGLTDAQIELLGKAVPLHDIGKLFVETKILSKPSGLESEEMLLIHNATVLGQEMLAGSEREMIQVAEIIAGQHHEWWDGTGYPNGISGSNIHIYARIVSVVNAYDSIRSELAYKGAESHQFALKELMKFKGKQFDPKIVDLVFKNADGIDKVFNSSRSSF
jgi:response regulator RpfG family c-di-GMP phosphodiesterase